MKDPNSENLLYLNPGINLLLLSSGPSLCSLPNERPNCVLNFELNDFPRYFSSVLSKLTMNFTCNWAQFATGFLSDFINRHGLGVKPGRTRVSHLGQDV